MPLQFRNLPLSEVVIRLSFHPPLAIGFEFINSLKGALVDEFPIMSELAGVEKPPGLKQFQVFTESGISGARFLAASKGLTLSLQSEMLSLRWRRQQLETADYPRFPEMKRLLWHAYGMVGRSAGIDNIPIHTVNMAYINVIKTNTPNTVLQHYFSDKVHIGLITDDVVPNEINISVKAPSGLESRFELKLGNISENGIRQPVFQLATAAGRPMIGDDNPVLAVDALHECLLDLFSKVLSADAKREWQMETTA